MMNESEVVGIGSMGAIFAAILSTKEVVSVVAIVLMCCICVFIMVGLDLVSGVRKAIRRGELSSSYGYKRTISKIVKYYSALFAISIIDVLQVFTIWHLNTYSEYDLPLVPIFTIIASLGICFVEFKSIVEPIEAKDRAKMQEVAKLAKAIADAGFDAKEIGKVLVAEAAKSVLEEKEVVNKD